MPLVRHAIVLLLSGIMGVVPALAGDVPSTIFGRYTGMKCPKDDATCISTTASDLVQVTRLGGGGIKVSARIIFGQGHTCQMEGNAEWSDGKLTLRADGLIPNEPCELQARIQGPILTLDDPGGRCQVVYCGARGAFRGAHFTRRQ